MKRPAWRTGLIIVVTALAVLSLLSALFQKRQDSGELPRSLSFDGEYCLDGGEWLPLKEDTALPAREGGITLHGHFSQDIGGGTELWFYRDHIGVSIAVNGETILDMESSQEESARAALCGREWYSVSLPEDISTQDEVEIRLRRSHTGTGDEVYREFLQTLRIGDRAALQRQLIRYAWPFEAIALFLIALALILYGASVAGFILRMTEEGMLWRFGALCFFGGGYCLLDMVDFSMWSSRLALGTVGRRLCVMLFGLNLFLIIAEYLSGRVRRIAEAAVALLGGMEAVCILLAILGIKPLVDTRPVWMAVYFALAALLIICCAAELLHTTPHKDQKLLACILLLGANQMDIFGVAESIYCHAACTKLTFLILAAVSLAISLRGIVLNSRASYRARQLETELEASRIDIMLSQIQPHFLYNTLTAIYQLCEDDPPQAKKAVGAFSRYIRRNLDALQSRELTPFAEELRHIKTYLWLEQLRFGDRLRIAYDIGCQGFLVPVLTVQPLVENAVKHGIGKRIEGGTVTITAEETPEAYVVTVTDDGVGFDPAVPPDDGRRHVGLDNIRSRLQSMCGGELTMESAPGQGTTAVIRIPRGGKRT